LKRKWPVLAVVAVGLFGIAAVRAHREPSVGPLLAMHSLPEVATTVAGETTNDGVFTDDQSKRGGDIYRRTCSACHDAELVGGGTAPALTGHDFIANWNDETLGSLFERIRTTMPADNPGSLSGQQVADLVAFILNFNKYPAGQAELTTDADALKRIKIAAVK
jgi:mono/diheme cytochrome c family protein